MQASTLISRRAAWFSARSAARPHYLPGPAAQLAQQRRTIASGDLRDGPRSMTHFKATTQAHPLGLHKTWRNPSVNHIWSQDEIDEIKKNPVHQKPKRFDYLPYAFVRILYNAFNLVTGYNKTNPPVKSVEYRLLILESVAGCPGMVAAGMRHFRSLRTLQRDHGWIHTLLEEAENERMHLLTCLKMFEAGPITRGVVLFGQYTMVPALWLSYMFVPKLVHRFVGYLEETAVHTYSNIIEITNTPGTHLNKAWRDKKAPSIAKAYWMLPKDAMWIDVLEQILADESHHRDINHTFASLKHDDPNPFIEDVLKDNRKLWTVLEKQHKPDYLKHHPVPPVPVVNDDNDPCK